MDDLPVVLHVGAPKAGSSALQHDLTWNPRRPLRDDAGRFVEYAAIDAGGNLLRGDALGAFAALFAAHYCMSADVGSIVGTGAERLGGVAAELAQMRASGTIPVLSYELWFRAPLEQVHRFTAALGAPIHVVLYVRDPVSWLRSLYWQRRGRLEGSRAEWLDEHVWKSRWIESVRRWRSAPGVVRLDVRLADGSVPRDFATLVGFEPPASDVRLNGAIPGAFARYLERHDVGPELHVSEARFAWDRWTRAAGVTDSFDPPPPTLDADDIRRIVELTSDASAALLPLCDEQVRSRIVADARWWSADPEVHGAGAIGPAPAAPVGESDRLLEAALRGLVAADGGWRAEERRRRVADATIARLEERLAEASMREGELAARLAAAVSPVPPEPPVPPEATGPQESTTPREPVDPTDAVADVFPLGYAPLPAVPRRGLLDRLRGLARRGA